MDFFLFFFVYSSPTLLNRYLKTSASPYQLIKTKTGATVPRLQPLGR